ncbi:IscS subfamily cysteine desulfurase [Bacillus methanolicus]|uniref:Cysteine desulfurase NifS n=1 Tax=Bacillus methanolicus (strain MGA3 / ATCC 53907) TaxID=796606 RepID=I3ECX6_BACMM|nr:IscS subfamily cysteine desulfurase [Bacillus methanolicus]AIE60885.1 Putative cysteine desulfurase NifS [Bacillus methanolicus MGA3]EIJ84347.1 cysteine desulfurase [Bacillus methanolicus MGA3]
MKYFDYAATCPLDEEAAQIFLKASQNYFGNTQSLHDIGSNASALLDQCRLRLAQLLNVEKEGIYFTSGGSESNFLAIHALLSAKRKKGRHIIAGQAEHSSIHSSLMRLEKDGYEISYLPFNKEGIIDLENLRAAIREDTVLITIHHANPEIGTVQPIEEIGLLCKQYEILFHTDCVQTFGKIKLDKINKWADSFSISSHKFYGPKGVGAVYVNPYLAWKTFYPGAVHERGFRPGTVNVPGIAAMTAAAEKSYANQTEYAKKFLKLRDAFKHSVKEISDRITIYEANDSNMQLPSIIGLRLMGLEGQWVMLECNRRGYAISTGTACQIGLQSPSKTMQALGIDNKEAKEFIRISVGRETTEEDVESLGQTIVQIVRQAGV